MIRFDGLRCVYGQRVALDDVTFHVARGEVVGLLGGNGAGKTTAMRAALGLVDPAGGTVTWDEAPVDQAVRQRIGYMPEERGLYQAMRAGEQVEYFVALHGSDRVQARASADRWLTRLGLAERTDDPVEDLSLGNQQRVQLALALAHDPELLILDEPLSGLDPGAVVDCGQILREQAANGRAVLLSSHQLDLVENLCDRVVILHEGRVVLAGSVAELTQPDPLLVDVVIDVDQAGDAARAVPPEVDTVSVEEVSGYLGRRWRLTVRLRSPLDAGELLERAGATGVVIDFGAHKRRLSEAYQAATVDTPMAVVG